MQNQKNAAVADMPLLTVCQLGRLGDIVATEPAYRFLHEHHPERRFRWYTRPQYVELLEFAPFIDEVVPVADAGEYLKLKAELPAGTLSYEFNFRQDIAAVRVVFESGALEAHIPCIHGAETLITTLPELEERCFFPGRVGNYLRALAGQFMHRKSSRIIWDISTVGIFAAPEAFTSELSPILKLGDDGRWRREPGRPLCRYVSRINRDPVFRALFGKLAAAADEKVALRA